MVMAWLGSVRGRGGTLPLLQTGWGRGARAPGVPPASATYEAPESEGIIPYSRKFSHGAKFRVLCGLVSYRENKNREILNLHVRVYACARATERARA